MHYTSFMGYWSTLSWYDYWKYFQRLYSLCTQTINQIIFTITGHSVPIEKLSEAYTYQKIDFTRSQRGEKVMPTQREVALTISLLELSVKEQIE